MINNQFRKQEFDKRRKYKGAESFCNAYECCIFQNCLLEINKLQQENEELKDNWNKLKEHVAFMKEDAIECGSVGTEADYNDVEDKMQEIESVNK